MSFPQDRAWTEQEFFAWAAGQEGRFEFDGLRPVAMTGGTVNHALIMQNVHAALRSRLRGSGCRPLGPDAGVATVGAAIRYPDALVTCARLDGEQLTVPGVVIVFEVVSAGTSRADRIIKVREYAAVPSIRRYVIIESSTVGLTVLERQNAGEMWKVTTLTKEDILKMPEIGAEVPVGEFYEDVSLASEASDRP